MTGNDKESEKGIGSDEEMAKRMETHTYTRTSKSCDKYSNRNSENVLKKEAYKPLFFVYLFFT